jgi:hypothetical protein
MLAAKFFDDQYFNNAFYAKVPVASVGCVCGDATADACRCAVPRCRSVVCRRSR